MGNTIKLYKNYGVLSSEFLPVYTYSCPCGVCHDQIDVLLPDGWDVVDSSFPGGVLLVAPWGRCYDVDLDKCFLSGDSPRLRSFIEDPLHCGVLDLDIVSFSDDFLCV